MKKSINKFIFLSLILLSFLFVHLNNVNALTERTSLINRNQTASFTIGDLSFSNVAFESAPAEYLGVTGSVVNNASSSLSYKYVIYFYDYNDMVLGYGSGTEVAFTGTNDFKFMFDPTPFGINVEEVSYYIIEINVSNNSTSNSKTSISDSYDYVINKYDIDIVVNENNTLDITEKITAFFNVPKHGIFRTIPLKNTITRLDGTTSKNKVQISNLSVKHSYTTSKENGNYKIKIGSASSTLTGAQTYEIRYTYNLGKDPVKNYDELYYNLIGNEWDTVIGNVTFTITMPKEFDSSKLGFSSGIKGSTDNNNVKYNVKGNKITGNYNGILGVGEALTVRCELPEGYFVGAGFTISTMDYVMFLIPILFLGVAIFLWYKFGCDEQVIETVEFYPPEGLNSLEVGFFYKGKADNQDVTSLLVYLANKGYVQIIDKNIDLHSEKKIDLDSESIKNANKKIAELQEKINEETKIDPNSKKIEYYKNMLDIYQNIDKPIDYEQYGLSSYIRNSNRKENFLIKKIKDYDGYNVYEEWFMDGLFPFGRTEVTKNMLYNEFYVTLNKILVNINNKNKNVIFESSASNKTIILGLFMLVSLLTTISIPTIEYAGIDKLFYTLIICAFYTPFFAVGIFSKMPIGFRIFWLGFTTFHSFFFFSTLPIAEAVTTDFIYLLGLIIGLLCLLGMAICFKLMPKRTTYGNEMLGKLRGFKNFLETAEKEKLEAMVMQDPSYFYNILPYTYVLGVSDKWIKKFETISLQAPDWYNSSNSFSVTTFGTFINTTMTSARDAMSSSPSSDSGGSSSSGSSSGGGSSGGGSGGGGGGSW